jgi:hypothetical protein
MSLDVSLNCKHCGSTVFEANITYNLGKMANEAGCYEILWKPRYKLAKRLTYQLAKSLRDLKERPEHYRQFNPSNNWGSYETLVNFIEKYLKACYEHPLAHIRVWS